jgi:hypothetical protein
MSTDNVFDEDVENNYNEDCVPDVLNPFVGSEPYIPTYTGPTIIQVIPTVKQPHKRGVPKTLKKKVCLTVCTASTLATPALFIH